MSMIGLAYYVNNLEVLENDATLYKYKLPEVLNYIPHTL